MNRVSYRLLAIGRVSTHQRHGLGPTLESVCISGGRKVKVGARYSTAARLAADTIFACSTGKGKYGVQIHRVSGNGSKTIGQSILNKWAKIQESPGKLIPSAIQSMQLIERVSLASQPNTNQAQSAIDYGMGVFFAAPRSYTGEDVLEIHSHGSLAVRAAVEEAIAACSAEVERLTDGTVRRAGPGEFSRRALAHGKLDLTRVEGLGSLLEADTESERRNALHLMEGALERQGQAWLDSTTRAIAMAEALLDFGEEEADVREQEAGHVLRELVSTLVQQLGNSLRAAKAIHGRASVSTSPSVVLAGAPNAGKSSLFNALLQRDASIVTGEAGTTRDAVEAFVEMGGAGARLVDTAGMRGQRNASHDGAHTQNSGLVESSPAHMDDISRPVGPVEAEGIRRAEAAAGRAGILVIVADAAEVSASINSSSSSSSSSEEISELRSERSALDGWKAALWRCASARVAASEGAIDSDSMQGVILALSKSDILCSTGVAAVQGTHPDPLIAGDPRDHAALMPGASAREQQLLRAMEREWTAACDRIGMQRRTRHTKSALRVIGTVATSAQMAGGTLMLAELLAGAAIDTTENLPRDGQSSGIEDHDSVHLLLRERHREAVRLALGHAKTAAELLGLSVGPYVGGESAHGFRELDPIDRALALGGSVGDLVAVSEELRACADRLGALLGRINAEDVLDVVFKEFCIGK